MGPAVQTLNLVRTYVLQIRKQRLGIENQPLRFIFRPKLSPFLQSNSFEAVTRIKTSQNESLPSSKCCKNTLRQIQKLIQLQSLSSEQPCGGCCFSCGVLSPAVLVGVVSEHPDTIRIYCDITCTKAGKQII